MPQTTHDPANPVQPLPAETDSYWPSKEVSYLIRTGEDALRLARILHQMCVNISRYSQDDAERLQYVRLGEELVSLAHHWDAPFSNDVWTRIGSLCDHVFVACEDGDGDEEIMCRLICDALRIAARRKLSESEPATDPSASEAIGG